MPLVPRHIQELEAYRPGKNIREIKESLGLNNIIKLASNENPFGPSPLALEAVKEKINENFRYPDASALLLRQKLANRFKLEIKNVTVGAGSEGIMSAIMRTFLRQGDEIIGAENSFIGFRVLAQASGHRVNWIPLKNFHHDLDSMLLAINDYTKLIYLANPDNPTGTYFKIDEFDRFMTKVPDRVLVILDEAYFEYAKHINNYPDSMHYRYDNVITLRTFSKAHGLAGFRVGYGFAHHKLIENLLKVKLPFEPSWPAQIAAMAAIDDLGHIKKTIDSYKIGMNYIEQELLNIGIKYIPSVANFITLIFKDMNSARSITESMLRSGIILRNLRGWGFPHCIRVSIGSKEEIDYFISCLKKTMIKNII
tara:strand:- start:806 stop:1906 length:1101 start_codon:yes stop_codon:yes gene_type:complete